WRAWPRPAGTSPTEAGPAARGAGPGAPTTLDDVLSVVSPPVIVQVPAKINLHLGVGDLRADGYHELTTVFQSLSLYDRISAYPADALTLGVTGEGAHLVPTDETNLAHRAATLL